MRFQLEERAGAAAGAAEAEAAAAAARRDADAAAARALALAERLAHAQRQLDKAHFDARKLHDDALVRTMYTTQKSSGCYLS